MFQPLSRSLAWMAVSLSLVSSVSADYRPVQFVKHTGDNGHADQAFSLAQYFNETTKQSDLYVRMETFRYDSSARGWASLALGPQMKGAFMFIVYGDPSAGTDLTLTIRTATSHTPPRPPTALTDFYSGITPEVDVISKRFEPYGGAYYHEKLKKKPSHLGVAEFIVRGYDRWTGCGVSNSSGNQAFIWSSNFKQDFQGDYSYERAIDMHQFGLGFGFLWADLAQALVPEPMFGPIIDTEGHKGVSEVGDPLPATATEFEEGRAYIISFGQGAVPSTPATPPPPAEIHDEESTSTPPSKPVPASTPAADPGSSLEQPVASPKQWNIRNLMWHLHGVLMILAFLILYPLGIYLLRTPRPTAFNLHWTIQCLGSTSVAVGAGVGYVNSHSISIAHQYFGIAIVVALAAQLLLGWRHHVKFLETRAPSWMGGVHVWLGRVALPAGMVNVVFGLLLRHYGWLTIALTVAVMGVEAVALVVVLGKAKKTIKLGGGGVGADKRAPPMTGADAEEYFQLAGDDDDDEFSDEEGGEEEERRLAREQKNREQRERLAALDKV